MSIRSFLILLVLVWTTFAAPTGESLKFVKKDLAFDYSSQKLYGVNLGSWFVLEPYITPSLFEAFGDDTPVDEYHFTQRLGQTEAASILNAHWSTWYTETDFENIASYGLNFVRIPIGYWAFQLLEGDPYVQGQEAYLDQALEWIRSNGLYCWIDLHGAPGSQNGFDNSGLRDTLDWQQGDNVNITLSVLEYISNKYGGSNYSDVVIGIELVNEPLGTSLNMDEIKSFYYDGYSKVRNVGDNAVIIHDAFQSEGYWNSDLTTDQGYWNVVLDHHHYQVFDTSEISEDIDTHISEACGWNSETNDEYHWSVCGEFSAALTDCAKWLNGVGRGARWDGSYESSTYYGSCENKQDISTWSSTDIANSRKYVEAQMDAFLNGDKNAGWVFWCFKTETTLEWDFKRLVNAGIIPQPLSDRQYPNQCGF
ncbi:hypothetical protein PACTADRAFT_51338 [Pachysolen tannophilus NRRL Y-2460]|uniref:Glucan 1,3-beta-glucosidase n=1 Tax=Pachysolen tannophilus NRRL Y-2460 TaxID=669874 RepID=A0A1E4TS14_PACTA|nr:hypothetical protein PACTADRAFT_51338 [Pachysolen tannophilus NRRL Y-2460]